MGKKKEQKRARAKECDVEESKIKTHKNIHTQTHFHAYIHMLTENKVKKKIYKILLGTETSKEMFTSA